MSLFPSVKGADGQPVPVEGQTTVLPNANRPTACISSLFPPVQGRPQIQISHSIAPTIPQPLQNFAQSTISTQKLLVDNRATNLVDSFNTGGSDFVSNTGVIPFGNSFIPSRLLSASPPTPAPFDPSGRWSHIRASLLTCGRMIEVQNTSPKDPLDWRTGRRANRPFENIYPRVPSPPRRYIVRAPARPNCWGEQQAAFCAMEPPSHHLSQQQDTAAEDDSPKHNFWGIPVLVLAIFFVFGQLLLTGLGKAVREATPYVVGFGKVLKNRTVWEHVMMAVVALLLVLHVFPSPEGDVRAMGPAMHGMPEYIIMIPYHAEMGRSERLV